MRVQRAHVGSHDWLTATQPYCGWDGMFGKWKKNTPEEARPEFRSDFKYPSEFFTCKKGAIDRTQHMTMQDYKDIHIDYQREIFRISWHHWNREKPAMQGCLLRFVGHDIMDFRTGE